MTLKYPTNLVRIIPIDWIWEQIFNELEHNFLDGPHAEWKELITRWEALGPDRTREIFLKNGIELEKKEP